MKKKYRSTMFSKYIRMIYVIRKIAYCYNITLINYNIILINF